jgi:class 3 adenylate cyclase
MSETRKIAAILLADVVGYSRLAGADEDRTLARLRALRSDLIDPTISVHHGRIVKRTGDGSVIEFRSVVDAVRCALEVQHAMVERNAGLGKQGANCRHAAPAAVGAAETSIRPSGGTRARGIVALEHRKDLDVREDIAGADDHRGPAL